VSLFFPACEFYLACLLVISCLRLRHFMPAFESFLVCLLVFSYLLALDSCLSDLEFLFLAWLGAFSWLP